MGDLVESSTNESAPRDAVNSRPSHVKVVSSAREAVSDINSGATILVGGWGGIGVPKELLNAVAESEPQNLTVVSNNCGMGDSGDIGVLFSKRLVSKAITTFPVHAGATEFKEALEAGGLEVEVTPQGTLAERLRSAGAGLGGFFTPTGYGTELAKGKEAPREINGKNYIFEESLFGDFALIRAALVDEIGNIRFEFVGRSFSPLMAMAARVTIVEAEEILPPGALHPDDIHLPGIFVDRIVKVAK
jgi:3-oxoadipate CoA-transferase, alpha subunit